MIERKKSNNRHNYICFYPVADAIQSVLSPQGAAVVIEATHMCMSMRGVQKSDAWTVTSAMVGACQEDPKTREEFLSLIRHRPALW